MCVAMNLAQGGAFIKLSWRGDNIINLGWHWKNNLKTYIENKDFNSWGKIAPIGTPHAYA